MTDLTFPLSKYLNEKVFILIERDLNDTDMDAVEICKFDTYEELEYYIASTGVTEGSIRSVYHGVLARATAIPATINKLLVPLIIAVDQEVNDLDVGIVIEQDKGSLSRTIADDIELLMCNTSWTGNLTLSIETTYIFYSYKINVDDMIAIDDVDEELIERCKEVAKEVNDIMTSEGVL